MEEKPLISKFFWDDKGRECLKKMLDNNQSFKRFQETDNKIKNVEDFLNQARDFLLKTQARDAYDSALQERVNEKNTQESIKQLAGNFLHLFKHILVIQGIFVEKNALGKYFSIFFDKKHPNVDLNNQFFTGSYDKKLKKEITTKDQKHPQKNKDLFFSFFYELKVIYDLRNFFHHPDNNIIQYSNDENLEPHNDEYHTTYQKICLTAYLALIAYYYTEIKDYLARHSEPDCINHLKNIQEKFNTHVKEKIVNKDPKNIIDLKLQHNNKTIYDTAKEENQFIIRGMAGIGKTTSLLYTAYLLATDILNDTEDAQEDTEKVQKPIPVFIELGKNILNKKLMEHRETNQKEISLIEYTAQMLMISYPQMIHLLERNRLFFIFDALNETDQKSLNSTKEEIKDLVTKYPNLKIILSDRPNARLDMHEVFKNLETNTPRTFQFSRIETEKIKDFLERNALNPIQKEVLHNTLENSTDILYVLQQSSFLMAQYTEALITITNPHQLLPKNKNEIIELYVNKIIEREIHQKTDNDFIEENKNIFINLLVMFANKELSTQYTSFNSILQHIRKDEPSLSQEILRKTLNLAAQIGFLEKHSSSSYIDQFKFIDLNFQQYFEQINLS